MRMRTALLLALLSGCAAPQPESAPRQARELVGRVAGTPQRCIDIFDRTSNFRVSDGDRHTLVYGSGKTVWANHLETCGFGANDIPVFEPTGSQYCRGDLVHSVDRYTRIPGPTCALGDFIPYANP